MNKLSWCLKQKKGITIQKPNKIIAQDYIQRAKNDFLIIGKQNPVWEVIIAYYTCYNAFYAVLTRFGIKSEIHSCTIHLLIFFKYLKEHISFIELLKENRENTQYYLKKPKKIDIKKIKKFIDLCELELEEVNQNKIENLHKIIEQNQINK